MKRCILVLALFLLTISVYSQTFSIDIHTWQHESQFRGVFSSSTFLPSIGVAFDTGSSEFLAELGFWSTTADITSGINANVFCFSIAAGIAPKFAVTEKITFSFPIMGKYSRIGMNLNLSNTLIQEILDFNSVIKMGLDINSFNISFGVRTYYILSPNWSVFAGTKTNVFSYIGNPEFTVDRKTDYIDFSMLQFFNSGSLNLGIRFSF